MNENNVSSKPMLQQHVPYWRSLYMYIAISKEYLINRQITLDV